MNRAEALWTGTVPFHVAAPIAVDFLAHGTVPDTGPVRGVLNVLVVRGLAHLDVTTGTYTRSPYTLEYITTAPCPRRAALDLMGMDR